MNLSGAANRQAVTRLSVVVLFSYFFWLMTLITLQYVPVKLDVAFLRVKQEQIGSLHYRAAFFIHVYCSIFALLLGFFQFWPYLRRKYRSLHRLTGKIYVAIVLLLSGPTGLIMGYYANGGPAAQISFCLLAILWIVLTYKAYSSARKKDFAAHKKYMIRSYALTLSAISLRLFKWGIATVFELPPMDTYVIVSYAGWMVNLAVAEGIILYSRNYSAKARMNGRTEPYPSPP
jgi:uncharacterized membrane protein